MYYFGRYCRCILEVLRLLSRRVKNPMSWNLQFLRYNTLCDKIWMIRTELVASPLIGLLRILQVYLSCRCKGALFNRYSSHFAGSFGVGTEQRHEAASERAVYYIRQGW